MSVVVSNITKRYGDQLAVDDFSFEVHKGQICGFLGPNGAGKTTTMKMLSCFTTPTSGTASVAGFDIQKDPFEVRRKLGYLPEHNPLYKNMYVKEYLNFVARLFHVKNTSQRVDEMIEMTGLQREQHKHISSLSKGYRQRVGLAQAMIHDPEVLILDEPTSGLDPNQLADIRQLIKRLGENKTVLFSSHIMQEIEAICDRIIIINQGKLVADDTKDVLKERLQGNFCAHVTYEKGPVASTLKKITGVGRVEKIGDHSFTLFSDAAHDIRKDIFKHAVENNLIILSMTKSDVSVESIFQQLTTN